MWRLGFFFHEMGFGLLSVFLPLHVIAIGGSLVDIGIMSAVALFLTIPASFFWGYVADKTRHYKRYILTSFLFSAVFLSLFTLTVNVHLLILLYAAMSVLHVAHEASKNVLISESYSRKDWERSFAFYEGFTETGWLIGLILGFSTSTYPAFFGFLGGQMFTLILCSALNLIAFVSALILVTDPVLVFERSLVSIEKSIDFAYHGIFLASRILDGTTVNERLKRESLGAFCGGLVLFSLATSILFTPMPIFVSNIAKSSSSLVFAIFILNSGGAVFGYFLAGRRSNQQVRTSSIGRIVLVRSLLSFLLVLAVLIPSFDLLLVTTLLMLMGFVYAMFLVYVLSLSMEIIPSGKAGLFNVLIGIGGACGSFVGPFLAQAFGPLGFTSVFVAAGVLFFVAYVAFKIFV